MLDELHTFSDSRRCALLPGWREAVSGVKVTGREDTTKGLEHACHRAGRARIREECI